MKRLERLLVVRTDRLGDLLMNVPLLSRLRANFPKSRITLAAAREWAPALAHQPDIDEVFPLAAEERSGAAGWLRTRSRLAAGRFDAAVISNPTKFFHSLCASLGIGLRAGVRRKWGILLTHGAAPLSAADKTHEIDRNLALADGFCEKPWDGRIDLGFGRHPAYAAVLARLGVPGGRRTVVFHAATSDPRKVWPAGRFAAVISDLLRHTDHPIALVGKDSEAMPLSEGAAPGRFFDLRGRTSLEELAILLREARLMVSLDSGPYHLAWMQKTPVVGLFTTAAGGSDPRRWGVYRDFAAHREIHKPAGEISEREVTDAAYGLLGAAHAA